MEKTAKIYLIKNLVNNKLYIGRTTQSLEKRLKQHKWDALSQRKNKTLSDLSLHKAMLQYGIENFTIELIDNVPAEIMCEKEIEYMYEYNTLHPDTGYNLVITKLKFRFDVEERRREKLRILHNTSEKKKWHSDRQKVKFSTKKSREEYSKLMLEVEKKLTPEYIEARNDSLKRATIANKQISDAQKSKYRVTFEDGRVEEFTGLYKWCKENGYTASVLSRLADGKRNKCKDIVKAERIGNVNVVVRNKNEYLLTHKNGEVLYIIDLTEFAKSLGKKDDGFWHIHVENKNKHQSLYNFISLERVEHPDRYFGPS